MEKETRNNMEVTTMENASVVDISALDRGVKDSVPSYYKQILQGNLFLTSLDVETFEDKMKLFEISSSDEVDNISTIFNKPIKVNDLYVEIVQINQDDGSKESVPRVVFITEDKQIYTTVSKGITNKLANLLMILGLPKWEKPIEFTFSEKKLDKGKRMNTFTIK